MGARLGHLCVINELTANSAFLIDNRSSTFLGLTFHLFFLSVRCLAFPWAVSLREKVPISSSSS